MTNSRVLIPTKVHRAASLFQGIQMHESIHSLFGSDFRHHSEHLVLSLGWIVPKAQPEIGHE